MIVPRDREWAAAAWARIIEDLADGTQNFGPDFDPTHPPGEFWWEIILDGETVGMTWARRFLKSKGVMNYGRGLFAEYRGKYQFDTYAQVVRDTCASIYEQVPECQTVICIVWDTNAQNLARVQRHVPEIGTIPMGDKLMHIFLISKRPQ